MVVGFHLIAQSQELEIECSDVCVRVINELFDDSIGADEVLIEKLWVDGGVGEEGFSGWAASEGFQGDTFCSKDVFVTGVSDLDRTRFNHLDYILELDIYLNIGKS